MTKWNFKINKKTHKFFIKGYKSFTMFSYQLNYPTEHFKLSDGSIYELHHPREYFLSINLIKSTITIRVRNCGETQNNIYICGEIL